jgi:peptidoglycan/xylan/chitin deacetylase (PgdA/CDA1 family)/3D (Asp-Asp-Asp) domain-containing protein
MAHVHSKKDNNFSSEREIQIKTHILFYSGVILMNFSKQRRFPNFIFNISKVIFPLLILSILVLNIIPYRSFSVIKYNVAQNRPVACNCVIFRMDDIQDFWIEPAQIAAMNLFMSKNQSLSLGLIMNLIGNDSNIVNKVSQGYHNGLFELALHGWNHVDYTKLSEEEQKDSLFKANEKMQKLFGSKSDIFITPNDPFNNSTLLAMSELGLKILSSTLDFEKFFDNEKSVFIGDGRIHNNEINQTVYHLPATIAFKDYEHGRWVKTPIIKILSAVYGNISKYGYAIIVFHPQDLAKLGVNGMFTDGVDENSVKDLSDLIDSILSKNIRTTSFSQMVAKYGPKDFTSTRLVVTPETPHGQLCSMGWKVTGYFTPIDSDYHGPTRNITVDSVNRTFFSLFLDAVKTEGWGKTNQGDYIGYYGGSYHLSTQPLDSNRNSLKIGALAADLSLLPKGIKLTIPTAPFPWNRVVFTVNDTGPAIKGKRIDVYVGEGKLAEQETFRITGSDRQVCLYRES